MDWLDNDMLDREQTETKVILWEWRRLNLLSLIGKRRGPRGRESIPADAQGHTTRKTANLPSRGVNAELWPHNLRSVNTHTGKVQTRRVFFKGGWWRGDGVVVWGESPSHTQVTGKGLQYAVLANPGAPRCLSHRRAWRGPGEPHGLEAALCKEGRQVPDGSSLANPLELRSSTVQTLNMELL